MVGRVIEALARAPAPRVRLPPAVVEQLFAARRFAARLRRKTVRVGALTLPYLEGGVGEPLVLLHGFSDNKDSFVDAVRGLVGRYRVVLPDLPGFGEASSPLQFRYSLRTMAAVLRELCDALGIERMHLGGNSLGGAIAARFALDHPRRVRSLVLVCAAGVAMPRPSPLQRELDAGRNPFVLHTFEEHAAFMRFVLEVPPPVPWPVRWHLAQTFIARAELNRKIMDDLLSDDMDLTPDLVHIEAPTLVLWGDRDRLIDVSAAHVFHRRVSDSRLVILHGIGHCPQYETPPRTQALLGSFFASVRAP